MTWPRRRREKRIRHPIIKAGTSIGRLHRAMSMAILAARSCLMLTRDMLYIIYALGLVICLRCVWAHTALLLHAVSFCVVPWAGLQLPCALLPKPPPPPGEWALLFPRRVARNNSCVNNDGPPVPVEVHILEQARHGARHPHGEVTKFLSDVLDECL